MQDQSLKNFGMLIPQQAWEPPKMVEDPNGAPIYRGCDASLCACTGRCKEIIGYSQDPEDLRNYRERIERYNQPRKPFNYGTLSEPVTKDGVTTRTWTIDKQSNL